MGIIQRQSTKSSVLIFTGFLIGALNLLVLMPAYLTQAQTGITRAMMDISLTLATLSTLGSMPVIYKFSPFYQDYLKKNENDLPFITALVSITGFLLILLTGFLFQDFIIRKLGKSPEFAAFFYTVYPFTFLMLFFMWLEAFAWAAKKAVISNFLKETLVRAITTLLIGLFALQLVSLRTFLHLFSGVYLLPVIILLWVLIKKGNWKFNIRRPGKVTLRLGKKMLAFGLFVFGAQALNVIARTSDTIFAIGMEGLPQAAVFTTGAYFAAFMDIPQRSITSISIPVLAEAWKAKDIQKIGSIYRKSVANLLVVGAGLYALIMLNMPDLVNFLNVLGKKHAADYSLISSVFLFMGLARVIDLGTGINAQIILTSNFWRFDFLTNVLYTLLSLPLNYLLIKEFGITGLAYANLISLTLYNLSRYIFLWKKFGLQPYNLSNLYTVLAATAAFALSYFLQLQLHWILNMTIQSAVFIIVFVLLIYKLNTAPELTAMADTALQKFRRIFKR